MPRGNELYWKWPLSIRTRDGWSRIERIVTICRNVGTVCDMSKVERKKAAPSVVLTRVRLLLVPTPHPDQHQTTTTGHHEIDSRAKMVHLMYVFSAADSAPREVFPAK
jgi:hypothetical protein